MREHDNLKTLIERIKGKKNSGHKNLINWFSVPRPATSDLTI